MKKLFKRMLISLVVFLIFVALVIQSVIMGNPLTNMLATSVAQNYLKETYPQMQLEIYDVRFDYGILNYGISVHKEGSSDIDFDIRMENGKVVFDNYNYTVANFDNTQHRLSDELTKEELYSDNIVHKLEEYHIKECFYCQNN